jgi:hypothetical protein
MTWYFQNLKQTNILKYIFGHQRGIMEVHGKSHFICQPVSDKIKLALIADAQNKSNNNTKTASKRFTQDMRCIFPTKKRRHTVQGSYNDIFANILTQNIQSLVVGLEKESQARTDLKLNNNAITKGVVNEHISSSDSILGLHISVGNELPNLVNLTDQAIPGLTGTDLLEIKNCMDYVPEMNIYDNLHLELQNAKQKSDIAIKMILNKQTAKSPKDLLEMEKFDSERYDKISLNNFKPTLCTDLNYQRNRSKSCPNFHSSRKFKLNLESKWVSTMKSLSETIIATSISTLIDTKMAQKIMSLIQELFDKQKEITFMLPEIIDWVCKLLFIFAPVAQLVEAIVRLMLTLAKIII